MKNSCFFLKQNNIGGKGGIVLYFLQKFLISGLIEHSWILMSVTNLLWYTSHENMKRESVIQSYPALWDPMDCSLPGISVHGILQARILEWVAMPFSRGSSWPQDWSQVSHISLPSEPPGKPFTSHSLQKTLLSFILSERIKVKKKKSEWVFFFKCFRLLK